MTWTVSASGITTALTTTELTLATDTTNGTYILEVDTSNMLLGDLFEIRVYTASSIGGTTAQLWKGAWQHPQINNHKASPPVASDASIKCTVTQITSAGKTFAWKLLRI